jgi:hypothetical protein
MTKPTSDGEIPALVEAACAVERAMQEKVGSRALDDDEIDDIDNNPLVANIEDASGIGERTLLPPPPPPPSALRQPAIPGPVHLTDSTPCVKREAQSILATSAS